MKAQINWYLSLCVSMYSYVCVRMCVSMVMCVCGYMCMCVGVRGQHQCHSSGMCPIFSETRSLIGLEFTKS